MEFLRAFIIGGAFCGLGQILIDRTKLTPARILTGYVVAGVVLSAIGMYAPIADFGGAGASVPLVGFGNLLAKGVKKAVDAEGFIGVFKGGVTASAAGIAASVLCGLIVSLLFKTREK